MEFIPIYAGILGIFIRWPIYLVLTKDFGSGKIEIFLIKFI